MSTNFPAARDLARDPEHPLARAFASFTEAAGSLERTYGQLQGQVAHLRQELEGTNRDLATSLNENHRIRERLRRIVEGLPCGVLVVEAGSRISTLNPEAARLVGGSFESADGLPAELSDALDQARQTGEEPELQLSNPSPVWVAIRHAWLERSEAHATSGFILRDVSEAKKLEHDREHLQRQQALVEMSALLAHEIRNPLGSLELFAGLLAEANLEGESRRWIEHVQAGLRTLSATVNNESRAGHGATFRLRLPRNRAAGAGCLAGKRLSEEGLSAESLSANPAEPAAENSSGNVAEPATTPGDRL
jgi:two-component system sensor histidine kinase FlrB